MRIACSRCETKYDLPEAKLDRGAVKIRCTRCGHVFVVKKKTEAPAPGPPPEASARFEDFDFGLFETTARGAEEEAPRGAEVLPDSRAEPRAEPVSGPRAEPPPKFEDFDFSAFDGSEQPKGAAAEQAAPAAGPGSSLFDEDELPPLGELDLGEFEETGGFGLDGEAQDREPPRSPARDTERVRREDLVSTPVSYKEVPVQGLAEDMPRLDLQKGPRRGDSAGKPSRLLARDQRRSPLFWAVTAVALGTGAFTGYNLYRHPEALTFLDPSRVRELWRARETEARFATEDVKGYALTLAGGRRAFIIRGKVVNHSGAPQGLIRVRGNLFAGDGSKLASSEVYCGNVLGERELATLPRAAVEARLQNQVGEALSNVDIAPGGKVPFMVIFLPSPASVEKFNVQVTASRTGSGA
jgi:predicted Zn finger-like uncharacterized protein